MADDEYGPREMTEIHKLSLSHRPLINDCLRRFPPAVSELTFTNLFVWRESKPVSFTEIDGTLIFLVPVPEAPETGWFGLGDPVGSMPDLAALTAAVPNLRGFDRITTGTAEHLAAHGWTVTPDEDNSDYVYRTGDLADLAGEKYHKKRNLVKQCLAGYNCQYEPITPALLPECLEMQHAWCEARNCGLNPGLCHENNAILETFRHFETLDLLGGAIRVNGGLSAFAVAEPMCPGMAVWHFEKALPEIHGLGQVINQWFADHALRGFEFVNREQDLGLSGLRQAKESYHPHHKVTKFKAFPPDHSTKSNTPPPPADARECERQEAGRPPS